VIGDRQHEQLGVREQLSQRWPNRLDRIDVAPDGSGHYAVR
jgi:hypothetical protein